MEQFLKEYVALCNRHGWALYPEHVDGDLEIIIQPVGNEYRIHSLEPQGEPIDVDNGPILIVWYYHERIDE